MYIHARACTRVSVQCVCVCVCASVQCVRVCECVCVSVQCVCECVCVKNLNLNIVRITVHILHFITASKMCRICYMTLTKECNRILTAIVGQTWEISEKFTVKN